VTALQQHCCRILAGKNGECVGSTSSGAGLVSNC